MTTTTKYTDLNSRPPFVRWLSVNHTFIYTANIQIDLGIRETHPWLLMCNGRFIRLTVFKEIHMTLILQIIRSMRKLCSEKKTYKVNVVLNSTCKSIDWLRPYVPIAKIRQYYYNCYLLLMWKYSGLADFCYRKASVMLRVFKSSQRGLRPFVSRCRLQTNMAGPSEFDDPRPGLGRRSCEFNEQH